MTWVADAALIWLFVSGCCAIVWTAAYRMGYRRGASDAIEDDIFNHRNDAE
jgi:hypothetical protein